VLKDGVVVERGSHSALIQVEKGIFKEMWEAQQQAEAESSSEESKPETDGEDGFTKEKNVVKMGTKSQGKTDDSDDRGLGLGYHSHGHHSHHTVDRSSGGSGGGGETPRNGGGTRTSTDTSVTSGATVSNGLLSKPSGGRTHMI